MKNSQKPFNTILNIKSILIAGLIFILAIILIGISEQWKTSSPILIGIIIPNIAAVMATSGVFTIVYEIYLRKAQTKYVLEAIDINESIVKTGLSYISTNYLDYDYASEIKNSNRITIFALYAQTWFNRYDAELKQFLKGNKCELILCLPNFNNKFLEPLSSHFGYKIKDFKKKITETIIKCITPCFNDQIGKKTNISIYLHNSKPSYSMYGFDNSILIGTYYGDKVRKKAPMFRFDEQDSGLFQEFDEDINSIIKKSDHIFDRNKKINLLSKYLSPFISKEEKLLIEGKIY
ncbi:hypothetical protein [Leptospira kanakyensis]|uniref:hypothetical protein n=1 Tax=Leptospira kanakyensis TaxID=2484968 RepID=UPI00223CF33E|nr:hypothetical protein [Leptospira kanakyensis]MCW7471819.1 hypothetical protein [Leptospira kanakyensis]